ncbi:MAG: sugar dehydrogenase [Herminiimonas sp.]|nr:sugar dehydrogenase [Herminiimonas sp.]
MKHRRTLTETIRRAGLAAMLVTAALSANSANSPPAGATQRVTVSVPAGLNSPPFDVVRTLTVPPGFSIRLLARVRGARFMAVAPNGDLLVSSPDNGTIKLLRLNRGKPLQEFTLAANLQNPHDMVFHTIAGKTFLYIAESNRIIRAPYADDMTILGKPEIIVANLPDASSPELQGRYGHQLKNIALNGNKLYVSIASTCNACVTDTVADPVRGTVYEYDADGKNRRLFAQGLRNAEGIRFRPGTSELWVAVNNRDNIAYPHHKDWDGDGTDDFGKVMPTYVDGHPPDLLTRVRDGGNYGWPFCNSNPDAGIDNMPFDRDAVLNADGSKLDCSKIDRVTKGMPPHSAPLGMKFLPDFRGLQEYRSTLVTALHGCWNCTSLNGHKVVLYPFNDDGSLGNAVDLVTGWLTDAKARQRWGRPVDVISDGKSGMYISDDTAGAVYWLNKN